MRDKATSGLTIALAEASELVEQLLDLALGAASADRAALLLVEDDGALACRVVRGATLPAGLPPVELGGSVLHALEASAPVTLGADSETAFPAAWRDAVAGRSVVLAPLVTDEGPLGLLLLAWDAADAGPGAHDAATTAAASLALVLEAAIESEMERDLAFWEDRLPESDRESVGRALAAIYLRSGLLRLVVEDGLGSDVAEIEALAFEGLRALRRSEESRGADRVISDELFDVLVELTGD